MLARLMSNLLVDGEILLDNIKAVIFDKDGTLIEVQDNNYLSYTNIASEEIMRALYSDFR